jgi:hypothetical protein
MRRKSEPKQDEVHNMGMKKTTLQEALGSILLNKYYSGNKITKFDMSKAYSTYGERRGAYTV